MLTPRGGRYIRPPVRRWPPIRKMILFEKEYKGGHPPFGPFPTVTNIVNAALCPVAAVHDLLYGIDNARMRPGGWGSGALFHQFIAHLKTSLSDGSCMPGGERRLYYGFAERKYEAAKEDGWVYVRYWLDRKRPELRKLSGRNRSYYEVYVSNDHLKIDGGYCSYPLTGKIDELDTINKRVIERTTLGTDSDRSAPALKDFQLWLLWKLLCSVKRRDKPQVWKDEDFKSYDLVVETPYRDFMIPKDSQEFDTMTHEAFSWIRDISSSRFRFAIWEAWQQASCSYDSRSPICTLGNRYCYRAKLRYPEGRRVIHADMRRFYLSLLNERMWSRDLLMYQLTKLPADVLSGWKILRGDIETARDGIVVDVDERRSLLERVEEGEKTREVTVIFGTLKLGLLRKAEIVPQNGKVKLKIWGRDSLPEDVHIILPKVSFFREEPWFLKRKQQREAYSFEMWGLKKPERARRHSVVQLVDAIWGDKHLMMEKPAKRKGGVGVVSAEKD